MSKTAILGHKRYSDIIFFFEKVRYFLENMISSL